MNGSWRRLIRETARSSNGNVSQVDAAASRPAQASGGVTASTTSPAADPNNRSKPFGSLRNMGTIFGDFRRLVSSAGVICYSRVFMWLELQAFVEACDYVKGEAIAKANPKRANNVAVILTADGKVTLPEGSYTPDFGLLDISDVESGVGTTADRARVHPITVWVFHKGYQITAIGVGEQANGLAILPEGLSVPTAKTGVTGFTAVYLEVPGEVGRWRVTGFTHWEQ